MIVVIYMIALSIVLLNLACRVSAVVPIGSPDTAAVCSCHLAYHILHCSRSNNFLLQILEEVQHFPVHTHVFIHTHVYEKLYLPRTSVRNTFDQKITISQHSIDREVSGGLPKHESRCELLAAAPGLRMQIVDVGRSCNFTMYAEDNVFVRRDTVTMWMERSELAFSHNASVGVVRVECTRLLCRSIDMRVAVPTPLMFDIGKLRHLRVSGLSVGHAHSTSGTWMYPREQLVWLDQYYEPFLRHNYFISGLNMRRVMGVGGAGAFDLTLYAVNDKTPPSLLPDSLVLHYGTRSWSLGVHWCELLSFLPPCLPTPDVFFNMTDPVVQSLSIDGHKRKEGGYNYGKAAASSVVHRTSTSKAEMALRPLEIRACFVQNILFNRSSFLKIASPALFIPSVSQQGHEHQRQQGEQQRYFKSLHVGYGPWVTKAGSTSARLMLSEMANASLDSGSVLNALTESLLHQYLFISFVRHPLERALAAHHQMEVFFHNGWLTKTIEKYDLRWWNSHCPINVAAYRNDSNGPGTEMISNKYKCIPKMPPTAATVTEVALRRLLVFLEEVSSIGFYDQHITPMSYLMATSPVLASQHALMFDIKSMFKVEEVLSRYTGGLRWNRTVEKSRDSMNKTIFPWILKWNELVSLSQGMRTDSKPGDPLSHFPLQSPILTGQSVLANLASRAIELLCSLYKDDIHCFPYDIPECKLL